MSTLLLLSVLFAAQQEQRLRATRETLEDVIVQNCERKISERARLREELDRVIRKPVHQREMKDKLQRVASLTEKIKQMGSAEPAHQLPMIEVGAMRPGEVGTLGSLYPREFAKVTQVISHTEAMIEIVRVQLWASGINAKSMADGSTLDITGCWEVVGTKSFATVMGAKRTVYEVRKFDASQAIESAERKLQGRLALPKPQKQK